MDQYGLGVCRFCGSKGTNASTCPLNPDARREPDWEKHYKVDERRQRKYRESQYSRSSRESQYSRSSRDSPYSRSHSYYGSETSSRRRSSPPPSILKKIYSGERTPSLYAGLDTPEREEAVDRRWHNRSPPSYSSWYSPESEQTTLTSYRKHSTNPFMSMERASSPTASTFTISTENNPPHDQVFTSEDLLRSVYDDKRRIDINPEYTMLSYPDTPGNFISPYHAETPQNVYRYHSPPRDFEVVSDGTNPHFNGEKKVDYSQEGYMKFIPQVFVIKDRVATRYSLSDDPVSFDEAYKLLIRELTSKDRHADFHIIAYKSQRTSTPETSIQSIGSRSEDVRPVQREYIEANTCLAQISEEDVEGDVSMKDRLMLYNLEGLEWRYYDEAKDVLNRHATLTSSVIIWRYVLSNGDAAYGYLSKEIGDLSKMPIEISVEAANRGSPLKDNERIVLDVRDTHYYTYNTILNALHNIRSYFPEINIRLNGRIIQGTKFRPRLAYKDDSDSADFLNPPDYIESVRELLKDKDKPPSADKMALMYFYNLIINTIRDNYDHRKNIKRWKNVGPMPTEKIWGDYPCRD
jgi:hypothetical protein